MAAASAAAEANDAPKLLAALKEMKDGLDLVRGKVEAITRKVIYPCLPLTRFPSLSQFFQPPELGTMGE
jgi:hypothetical protein